jgi:hypothetical protein
MADYVKEHYDFPLTQKSQNKPLKGVRVIDAGNMVAAPFATVLLTLAPMSSRSSIQNTATASASSNQS